MMKFILLGKYNAAILCLLAFLETASSSRASNAFYQPGHGVVLDWWLTNHTWNSYNTSHLEKLVNENKDFKKCPLFAANADSFEHTFTDKGRLQYGRYRAYFIAPQTGYHRFFAVFNSRCTVDITRPYDTLRGIDSTTATEDDWKKSVWTKGLRMYQGFLYKIVVFHYAYGGNKAFFRLGVKLPDGTEVKPISKNYLWRSMVFYKWAGVLAEKHDPVNFPSWESYSVANIMNINNELKLPTSYHCKSTLWDESPNKFFGSNYTLSYLGYFKPTRDRNDNFKLYCDAVCELVIDKLGGGTKKIEFVMRNYTNPGSVTMQKFLKSTEFYAFTVFLAATTHGGYIRIAHGDLSLLNIKEDATSVILPTPVTKVINQTFIKVTLQTPPSLPPKESWTYVQKYDLFYRQDPSINYIKFALNGSLPISVDVTGLRNYTRYYFHARYYGYVKNSVTLNRVSEERIAITAENVPGKPPTSISVKSASSTSVKVTWGSVPSDFQYGIIRQYNVYFKQSSKPMWEKQTIASSRLSYHHVAYSTRTHYE
eukprot:Seg3148.1 transcript_id=Seg3148.1/GoldUCD/mRNA.D3Y31 product="Netrin receptor DCC" protein_id=Seg3148.1/GoldUCD/D3Y31